jgi:hypothetical protein
MVFPITIATAMVSPRARPRPRITAPDNPNARVAQHSGPNHLPARRPQRQHRLPLRMSAPTSIMSRVIEEMMGKIMIARMMLASQQPQVVPPTVV